jgi:hypothetical protein
VFASLAVNSVVIQRISSAFHMSENLNIFTNDVQSSGQMVSVDRFLLSLIIHVIIGNYEINPETNGAALLIEQEK